jgi:hypothetical protein
MEKELFFEQMGWTEDDYNNYLEFIKEDLPTHYQEEDEFFEDLFEEYLSNKYEGIYFY